MIGYRNFAKALAAIFFLIFAFSIQIRAQDDPPDPDFYGLPAGTTITVRMDNEINTKSASVDDTFTVTVADPVEIDGLVVLPAGTVIEGRITEAKAASFGRKDGVLEVRFETLYIDSGRSRAIDGIPERDQPHSDRNASDLFTAIGSAAAGGVLGAAAAGGKGAVIGAGLGTGGGLGAVLLRKGSELRIRENEEFRVRLLKPVSLPARGY